MMSLLSCVKYSKPLSCMSKTIRAMFVVQYHYHQSVGITIQAMSALSSGQCRRCHQAGVGHVSPRLSDGLPLLHLWAVALLWSASDDLPFPSHPPFQTTIYCFFLSRAPFVNRFTGIPTITYRPDIARLISALIYIRIYSYLIHPLWCSI